MDRVTTAKRIVDVGGAALGLLLAAPLLAVLALLLRREGGRVLFRQRRVGLGGRPFVLLKLRTVPEGGGTPTALGGFLRRSSLDELPQLWNVLAGQMSLVGPRPLVPEEMPPGAGDRARRQSLRPGLTGLAQVRGRDGLSPARRTACDLEYVAARSLLLDLGILLRTVPVVLALSGAGLPRVPAAAAPPKI
jgi:lipopolysaccharide/colanic/teichoic acid biosynthesis glycosyltransferase